MMPPSERPSFHGNCRPWAARITSAFRRALIFDLPRCARRGFFRARRGFFRARRGFFRARRGFFRARRGFFRAPPGRSKCAAFGGGDCRV